MTEGTGIWLYAVTRQLAPGVLDALRGVAGEEVRVVRDAGLSAVVGDVPMETFGEEPLHRNFEDLDWLGGVARAHDAVISAVVAAGPAVPIRLATVYHDEDRVRRVLEHRRPDFERALDFVTGRTEWGVKAFLQDPGPGEEGGDAGNAPSRRGAGTAYLARRKAALSARETTQQRGRDQAVDVYNRLLEFAVAARTHPPQSKELSGHSGQMMLNAAYLVDEDAARGFAAAVAACDDEHPALHLQLTGPWPPYSFASVEES
ncbi:GvpL/GvpF family gas vesicle protein [Amycolatopsis thermophila]|uniref:GvpL/GvpF family gas vesicle protein n=1 Tax=Amycolatopsis thermophila TaxID=206084 RepID=A0ABU0EZ21_9PSEU|nr:GvpL/GvpF family gas vesicle protein [Amycolatopsis thermophila]MDQ0380516.1 hypothetical protein [Amycolatopsis thermophila]